MNGDKIQNKKCEIPDVSLRQRRFTQQPRVAIRGRFSTEGNRPRMATLGHVANKTTLNPERVLHGPRTKSLP